MKTKILSILIVIIISFSCKTDKKETIILKPNEFTNIQIEILNDEKWVVDKPMMDIIVNIKKDVMQFDGKTLEDYNNLANKIKKHLDVLTSSCTMKGQGHDELHKWLLPFLDISKEFTNSRTLKDAQENYQVIKHSFNLVDKNFK
jgi:hypothetical protein